MINKINTFNNIENMNKKSVSNENNNPENSTPNVEKKPVPTKEDKVTLTSLDKAKESIMAEPKTNQEKVDKLKKMIESGEYVVDSNKVAKGIVNLEKLFS